MPGAWVRAHCLPPTHVRTFLRLTMSAELPTPASAAGHSRVREVSNRPPRPVLEPLPAPRHAAQLRGWSAWLRTELWAGAVLPIEAARTHAHATSTGVVAVFRVFRAAAARSESPPRYPSSTPLLTIRVVHICACIIIIQFFWAAAADPRPTLGLLGFRSRGSLRDSGSIPWFVVLYSV